MIDVKDPDNQFHYNSAPNGPLLPDNITLALSNYMLGAQMGHYSFLAEVQDLIQDRAEDGVYASLAQQLCTASSPEMKLLILKQVIAYLSINEIETALGRAGLHNAKYYLINYKESKLKQANGIYNVSGNPKPIVEENPFDVINKTQKSELGLHSLFLKYKIALASYFEAADPEMAGLVLDQVYEFKLISAPERAGLHGEINRQTTNSSKAIALFAGLSGMRGVVLKVATLAHILHFVGLEEGAQYLRDLKP